MLMVLNEVMQEYEINCLSLSPEGPLFSKPDTSLSGGVDSSTLCHFVNSLTKLYLFTPSTSGTVDPTKSG